MAQPLVFLGGVSGAGKSHALGILAEQGHRFEHLVAGKLIAEERAAEDQPGHGYIRPPVADAASAATFQQLLLDALQHRRSAASSTIVLDGHFVVPTEAGPSPVAASVFTKMQPSHLLLLEPDPDHVATRLEERTPVPKWWDGTVASVRTLVRAESEHARQVASALGLPLVLAGPDDILDRLAAAMG